LTLIPKKIGFGNALVENIATGCTMVLNKKAILLISEKLPDHVYIHDWWCYLVISCFGEILFDPHPHIKYRQHGKNTIGVATTRIEIIKRKLARFISGRLWISEQAAIFFNLYNTRIPECHQQTLSLLIKAKSSYCRRIQLALSKQIWRQKQSDNLILRFLILINRI
jgi:hypothetical protein